MLSEETVVDQITVTENAHVLVREVTRIFRDKEILSFSYHRTSLSPGDDCERFPKRVQAVCRAVWTKEALRAWEEAKAQEIGIFTSETTIEKGV